MTAMTSQQYSSLVKIGAAFYFGAASFLVQFVNKALFTTYLFPFPVMVALMQLSFTAPVCYIVSRPKLEMKTARIVLPLAIVNVMNVVSGLISTGGLTVPMYIALRRFTLLITLILEKYMYAKRHSTVTHVTTAVMMSGAVLAASTDATFKLVGYTAVFVNNIFTSLYLILMKNVKGLKDLGTVELIFYNSALSIPMLLFGFVASGEAGRLSEFSTWNHRGFQMVLLGTATLGITIHHSTFVCTRVNEPIMTMVAGQMKNIISTILGAIIFSDFIFAWPNVFGLLVSMIGALWYAADGILRSQPKIDLPVKSSDMDGTSEKLKNYTQIKHENGHRYIPVIATNGQMHKDEHKHPS